MSTIPPPNLDERPWWRITYASGDTFSSDQGQWNDQALLMRLGGIHVPVSKEPIKVLHVCFRGVTIAFAPPEPDHLFAFARVASPVLPSDNNEPHWRYTLFGYECETYRSLLICTPMGFEVRSQSPDDPLPL